MARNDGKSLESSLLSPLFPLFLFLSFSLSLYLSPPPLSLSPLSLSGPAEAIFHWSGLYETFLCNNLNEVVVAQRAREGFALAKLGGSGGMLPREILDFWTLQNAILGFLANFSHIFVGSRGAVVSAALSERKVAGSIPTIGDLHTVGPCKKAVFACLATDVK